MSWFSDLFTGGVDKVVDSVSKGLDNLFTSDEERLILRNKLQEALNNYNLELQEKIVKHEQEITKRWQSDNEHIITRLIRPLSYAWVIFIFTVVVIGDGSWGFNVKEAYIPVFETLLTTMTLAYFGGRTLEKYKRIGKDNAGNQ